jgi:soluble lytic murein transglycosylase-like protein
MLAYYLSLAISHCHDPRLAMAIMKVESNYNKEAILEDSVGLMQIRLSTAKWIGCENAGTQKELMGVESNIKCGCKYLGILSSQYKKATDVMAAYNAGAARICKTGVLKPSGRGCRVGHYINQEYVDRVMKQYREVEI